jgi:hypothetical protein
MQRVTSVSMALRMQTLSNGSYPKHAAELLNSGTVGIGEMSLSTNPLDADNIILGNTTLGKFQTATDQSKQQMIATAVATLPANVIAHRLGDYVFTYHGLPTSPDPGLWLFVAEMPDNAPGPTPPFQNINHRSNQRSSARSSSPAPVQESAGPPTPQVPMGNGGFSNSASGYTVYSSGMPPPMPVFLVGLANGRVQPVAKQMMAAELAKQNSLRASFGLPPLPDPTTVTEGNPAVPLP